MRILNWIKYLQDSHSSVIDTVTLPDVLGASQVSAASIFTKKLGLKYQHYNKNKKIYVMKLQVFFEATHLNLVLNLK